MKELREGQRRIREFACPRCGAGTGERCVTRSGRRANSEHADRFYAAVQAGRLPIIDVPAGTAQWT